MTSQRTRLVMSVAGFILLMACASEEPPSTDRVRPVIWQAVEETGGSRSRSFAGSLQAGQESRLSFKVDGTLEELRVKVGDEVKRGALIARLDTRELELAKQEALAQLRRQEAQLRNAAAERDREEGLYENENTTLSSLQRAEAEHESARQGVRSAQSALGLAEAKLGYARLRAPVDGAIAEVLVEENENIGSGQTVAVLASGSQIEVRVAVPGVLIGDIRTGDEVNVRVGAAPDAAFKAIVTEVGVTGSGAGTTFPVTARLEGEHPELRAGMAAEVELRLVMGDGSPRILVPPRAIGDDRRGRHAFVVRDIQEGRGTARRVAVETGELTRGGLEVSSGLSAGDVLVTAGIHALTDGQVVAVPES